MRISSQKLKAAIIAADVSPAEVGKAADLSERRIQQIQARGGKVNMNIVKAIAKRLCVKPEALTE